MSLIKIEYPSLQATRVAATVTHGDVQERVVDDKTLFFKVTQKDDQPNLEVIGWFSNNQNYGVVYDSHS